MKVKNMTCIDEIRKNFPSFCRVFTIKNFRETKFLQESQNEDFNIIFTEYK